MKNTQKKKITRNYHLLTKVESGTGYQVLGFPLDRGLEPGYNSGGEGRSTCKGKISAQIKRSRVVDFSSDIFLAQSSLGQSLI